MPRIWERILRPPLKAFQFEYNSLRGISRMRVIRDDKLNSAGQLHKWYGNSYDTRSKALRFSSFMRFCIFISVS